MASILILDDAKRKKFALWGIVVNLMFLHAWASAIIAATIFKKDLPWETMQVMFSSIMSGIGVSLLVLVSDKAVEFIISRFGGGGALMQPQTVSETVTRTVTPARPAQPVVMPAKDVNIQADGDVSVNGELVDESKAR